MIDSLAGICCRAFNNIDPPRLAELWNQAGDQRGLVQPISAMTWESEVLAKPYFDPSGLILAERDGQVVGMIHAGFGAVEGTCELEYQMGVVTQIIVQHGPHQSDIEDLLLRQAEAYLVGKGAKVLYGGQMQPLNPFYFGLYGRSDLGGVHSGDESMHGVLRRAGYQPCSHSVSLQRELFGFRPPSDRRAMQNRRQYHVIVDHNPPAVDWWQACMLANTERVCYRLVPRQGGPVAGEAIFWSMEAMSRARGATTFGLLSLSVNKTTRGQGLGGFLVAESLRQLHDNAVKIVETQTMSDNVVARRLYEKLGFAEVAQGTVYRRP
ncbi:MAG: GNAT family N-acetyltransferase [Planctomycetota bacterium]|nr:GNAT family N-acetyltransferase [Planctomycetota bacterium]MDA1180572.1 GNAT family N-acetyltransferase [Planctomycetota bacterium]